MSDTNVPAIGSIAVGQELQELVASCELHVKDALGMDLDGTIETLPIVDHYLRISTQSVQERPELVALISRTVGAYFGQVIANHFEGFWWAPTMDIHHWYICLRPAYFALNPIGIAHQALVWSLANPEPGPPTELHLAREDREGVEARLANLPPVQEKDFHSLCTCVEGIEVAVAALREQMVDAGTADVIFDEDDYSGELGDPSLA